MPDLLDSPFHESPGRPRFSTRQHVSATATPPATVSLPRFPLGTVILVVSPLAPIGDTMAAIGASLTMGNRTIITFPAGAPAPVRARLAALSGLVGEDRLRVAGARELAADPDADLGHVASVSAMETRLDDAQRVAHGVGSRRQRRDSLTTLLSTDFSTAEWDERVGATSATPPCASRIIRPPRASGTFGPACSSISA